MKVADYDPRMLSAYTITDAARIVDMPRSTLSAWKKGQDYISQDRRRVVFRGPIQTRLDKGLSYYDLVEAFVLRSMRTEYGYSLKYIRKALEIAQEEYEIGRLFLHKRFCHNGKDFFLDRLNDLETLSEGHQMASKILLNDYLKRIEYAPDDLAKSFYPVIREVGVDAPRLVVVDPRVAFGRPVIKRRGIRTSAIANRLEAGESKDHIIDDFELTEVEFEQAIRLEAA